MNRLDLLAHLALVPQDVPNVINAGRELKAIADRHATVGVTTGGGTGGLALEAPLSAEEEAHVQTIVANLSTPTSAFDPSTLISVATFLAQNRALLAEIFKLFRKG